jgi:hypothetical protein
MSKGILFIFDWVYTVRLIEEQASDTNSRIAIKDKTSKPEI